MEKNVAIIGAGLTGLSSGIILQRSGVQSTIYEKAPWAGGVCTAWVRKGYTFDGCIHWMVGTKKGEPMRKMYEEVRALEPDSAIFHLEELIIEIEHEIHHIPLNLMIFKNYLLQIAPEDTIFINHFCKEIKNVMKSHLMAGAPKRIKDYVYAIIKGRSFLRIIFKYLHVTVADYCKKVKNKKLIKIIYHLMNPSFSMFALLMMLGTRMSQNGGFPLGGARDMIKHMQDEYIALGGKLILNTQIVEIIVENQNVTHIKSDKEVYAASHVIAACDMHDTLNHMLKGKYPHPVLNKMLVETPLFDTIMLISIGIKKKFYIPYSAIFETDKPIHVGNKEYAKAYHIRSFDFDPSFAPHEHSSIMVMISAPFNYWFDLKKESQKAYYDAKMEVAYEVISDLEEKYPGITDEIEVIDVATPSTYYTLNNLYKGSYEGFLPVPQALKTKIKKQVPGINNLYLAGQWVTPGGGIPPAIMSGIETALHIIKIKKG